MDRRLCRKRSEADIFRNIKILKVQNSQDKKTGGNQVPREDSHELFYAKILLFGEYSVIFNSMALSIPFGHFTAGFSFLNLHKYTHHTFAIQSNTLLKEYCSWLSEVNNYGSLKNILDTDAFKRDLDQGMFLESNIPQGYGLGSSGALCAAVYDRYAVKKLNNGSAPGLVEMRELKKIFAIMESWFHGTSSGMDPLNSYFRRPVLVEPVDKVSITKIPRHDKEKGAAIFLINTGRSRKTEPLVKLFLEKSKKKDFMELIEKTLIPSVNQCIYSMVSANIPSFMSGLKTISRFQLDNMKDMIPEDYMPVWENGLNTDDYYLKLCGSGGGGYLLGFTRNMEKTADILLKSSVSTMPVYMNTSG
jgi:mevalonate kinase